MIKKWIKNVFSYIKEMIIWNKDKELIEEQMKIDTRRIDLQKLEISKLKHKIEELKFKSSQSDKYLETIKEQRKEIKRLKKEMKEC